MRRRTVKVRPFPVLCCRWRFSWFNHIGQLHSRVGGQFAPGTPELSVGAGRGGSASQSAAAEGFFVFFLKNIAEKWRVHNFLERLSCGSSSLSVELLPAAGIAPLRPWGALGCGNRSSSGSDPKSWSSLSISVNRKLQSHLFQLHAYMLKMADEMKKALCSAMQGAKPAGQLCSFSKWRGFLVLSWEES